MSYTFRYRLNRAPEPRIDGSGQVAHDVEAVYRLDELEPPSWVPVPGHHKTILLPGAELEVVLAMPNTGAKVTAYKQLLVEHRNDESQPLYTDWQTDRMAEFLDAGVLSAAMALAANDYITVTLGQGYPVTFAL